MKLGLVLVVTLTVWPLTVVWVLMSVGDIARSWVNVGGVVGGGWGRLLSLRVNWKVTLLPTDPASSVAKISTVFRPLVVKTSAGSNVMAKLPRALVQLDATLVPETLEGLKPPMIFGWAGSVTSSMVIQVALPKPVISLRPSKVAGPVTIGLPSASVPEALVGATATELGKTAAPG